MKIPRIGKALLQGLRRGLGIKPASRFSVRVERWPVSLPVRVFRGDGGCSHGERRHISLCTRTPGAFLNSRLGHRSRLYFTPGMEER